MSALAALASLCLFGCRERRVEPLRVPPVVVMSPLHMPIVVVRGGEVHWAMDHHRPLRLGDPVTVSVTEYCLRGTTRRGRYVRPGIAAADPRLFPLARYIELYVGQQYLGRFLVDDTGGRIRGAKIDVWTPSCREARRFGRQAGTAVLVPRPQITVQLAGKTKN
ncbi:MAG TPA: 3D domain-containing protein [Gemmatimonadaceae bacterium]